MLVEELVNKYYPKYKNIFPEECVCGHKLEYDTHIYCPNPNCSGRMPKRLKRMMEVYGCEDFGERTCEQISENIENIWEVYNLQPSEFPRGQLTQDKLYTELHSKKRMPLWRLIQGLGIKGIDNSAKKIFMGFNSLEDFVSVMTQQDDPFLWLSQRLDFKNVTNTSIEIIDLLKQHAEEITELQKIIEIEPTKSEQVLIAISGEIEGFSTKQDFVDLLNNNIKEDFEYMLNSTITKKCKLLITDLEASGNITKANNYGIPVVSSKEICGRLGITI